MDPLSLLRAVAERYRTLRTLQAEALVTTERRDPGSRSLTETRVTLAYSAPNRLRIEQGGRQGMTIVCDGEVMHNLFGSLSRYSRHEVREPDRMPGRFRPEFAVSSECLLLYDRVHERVGRAVFLREEALDARLCRVVEVTYEPPAHAEFVKYISPVAFWIDAESGLIVKQESESAIQFPDHLDPLPTKRSQMLTQFRVDEPVPAQAFQFKPPEGALDVTPRFGSGGFGRRGGGGGGGFSSVEGSRRVENQNQHHWDGDTLIEHSTWKFLGHRFTLERRWNLSDDGSSVEISERIEGPKSDERVTLSFLVG